MRIVKSETSSFAGQRGATSGDSGNAMVVALLVLLVLTTAGVAFVAVTKSEKQIAGNTMTSTQALYAAEAGITEGLHRMSDPAESLNYIGPTGTPAAGWGRYIVMTAGASVLDPDGPALEHDGMDNNENGLIDEPGERYPEVLTKQTVNASALQYPYVRLEYKTQGGNLVLFGDADNDPSTPPVENFANGAPVLRITARGKQGSADKILEAEAVRFPSIQVESAVWAGGPLNYNGNSFLVDGHDHQATAPYDTIPGGTAKKGTLTKGPASDAPYSFNQADNVNGDGGNGSVAQSAFTYDFNALWAKLSASADYSFSGAQSWNGGAKGSFNDVKVTAVDGDLHVTGGWTGGGILIVNGNLEMTGQSQFTGIVVALGDVKVEGNGPHVVGGLVYQGTIVGNSKIGGNSSTFYSSEAVNAAQLTDRYTLSWWRER